MTANSSRHITGNQRWFPCCKSVDSLPCEDRRKSIDNTTGDVITDNDKSAAVETDMANQSSKSDCSMHLCDLVRKHDAVRLVEYIKNDNVETTLYSEDFKSARSSYTTTSGNVTVTFGTCNKSPLDLACELGYTDIILVFINHGCSPDLPTSKGRLIHSVMDSIKCGQIPITEGRDMVKELAKIGCDFGMKDVDHKTTIHYGVELGDSAILSLILSNCPKNQLKSRDRNGFTPIHIAAMKGDISSIKMLLNHCSEDAINVQDNKLNTPLSLCIKSMLVNSHYIQIDKNSDKKTGLLKQHFLQCQYLYNCLSVIETLLMCGASVYTLCEKNDLLRLSLKLVSQLNITIPNRGESDSDSYTFSKLMESLSRNTIKEVSDRIDSDTRDISPFCGLVRLLVLSGAKFVLSWAMNNDEFQLYYLQRENASVQPILPSSNTECSVLFCKDDVYSIVEQLLGEMFAFWDKVSEKPYKLTFLTKSLILETLKRNKCVMEIDQLPLPDQMKMYLKLRSVH